MGNTGTTVFPTSLDDFTNVGTSTYEDDVGYSHVDLHNQVHEAIEAVETKIGITGSSGTATVDYKLSDVTGTSKAIPNSWDGWISAEETWTYASATTFTVAGVDVTAKYPKGTKLKLTQTTVKYFYVVNSAFSTDTTITITGGSDYTLANAAITNNYYSYIGTPQGFPQWFNYTPTYGAGGSMTFGSVTTNVGEFAICGMTTICYVYATGTTAGTASSTITYTLPVACNYGATALLGAAWAYDSGRLTATFENANTTTIRVYKHDSSNWGLGATKEIAARVIYKF